MSYIELDGAIAFIKENQCKKCSDIGLCGNCSVLTAIRLLEKVPASDVAPVVRGKWIDDNGNEVFLSPDGYSQGSCSCSVCGEWLDGSDEYAVMGRYCPSCGAKMMNS